MEADKVWFLLLILLLTACIRHMEHKAYLFRCLIKIVNLSTTLPSFNVMLFYLPPTSEN